jgi:glycosyltransferase involved in cell wall biosynthesis
MAVSVVIPTLNRAELLPRALESVFTQSRPPEEVIVVDDGSTDGTGELVRARFGAARYLSQSHAGVSAARNRGIRAATGEWVALLDSDDEWLPEKLERQLAALEAEPDYDLCHCDEVWMRRGRRVNPRRKHAKSGGWIFQSCLPLCAISPSAALIRRSVFDEIGFFAEDFPACEDYEFWLRFCARKPVLFLADQLVVKHGGRDDQLSHRLSALDRYRVVALDRVLASGALDETDAAAARQTLLAKAEIFVAGARRRGRHGEADRIAALARRHRRAALSPPAGGA